jgi:hypothetical protein
MSQSQECNLDHLSDAIDGLLDKNELVLLHQHLEKCAFCSKAYEELKQVSSRLQSLPAMNAPQDVLNRVRKTIHAEMTSQREESRTWGWFSAIRLYPWRGLALAGAACLVVILALQISSDTAVTQPCVFALELQTSEEVAGLDIELALSQEETEVGKLTVPADMSDFVVASHTQGSTMRVSMASAQAIRPSGKTHILEMPLIQRAGSAFSSGGIQVLSIRAYRVDGKPAHAEIKATPMLPTRDSKLNTTA